MHDPLFAPRRAARLLAILAAALPHAVHADAVTTPNLLVNGDAEVQRCTSDWTAQTSVPGWRIVRGAASVLCYDAFDVSGSTIATPPGPPAGRALFAAPGADTMLEQAVDVSAAHAPIDAGAVGFELSAWLGGWADRPEQAALVAVFLDDAGHATGAPVAVADAAAAARDARTALVQRAAAGAVPPGTRRIVVTLQFLSGLASFHNAYADNVRLRLHADEGLADLASRATAPAPTRIPALDHVFVVMMENTNYADVIHTRGATSTVDFRMPFFAALAQRGVLMDNLWQTYHPSDQNYVAMVAGDTFRKGPVYFPDYHLAVPDLGDLLDTRGKHWRAYVQDMRTPCNLSSIGEGRESFSPDDEPFVQFRDVIADPQRCAEKVRDLADLKTAIDAGTLPDFAWIAANNWWDGEGAWYENYDIGFSNARQDQFLQATLAPLLASDAWRDARSLLVVTWDETNGWGWPDNRVPTLLVGSEGLLRAGTTIHEHANGYDLLRTIESGLRVDGLERFDTFARPLNEVFSSGGAIDEAAGLLWPTEPVATRGGIEDTFGRSATAAAVDVGQPATFVVPAGVGKDAFVNLEPVGQVPNAASTAWRFDADGATVAVPTEGRAPGFYGAWLRRDGEPPALAPAPLLILPRPTVNPDAPGVEIVGAAAPGTAAAGPALREGSNPIVRYCLPAGGPLPRSWVGIFPAGTPLEQMNKANANRFGYWLKTPGAEAPRHPCGEAEAYVAELRPNLRYVARLFRERVDGSSTPVGRVAPFSMIPALPH